MELAEIDGGETLQSRIAAVGSIEEWSRILQDYLVWGNRKIADTVAIFNFNSAHDCPNRETDNCQVPWESCYAGRTERQYSQSLAYRRRQEFLWDCITPEIFAKAFLKVVDRKVKYGNGNERSDYDLRFSQSGDFRTNGDVVRAEGVASRLEAHGITTYTYSASDYLNWSPADTLVVNQSNDRADYGDRRYTAFTDGLPDGAVWCPHDKQKLAGKTADEAIKCGDCRLCLNSDGPDVGIPLHD